MYYEISIDKKILRFTSVKNIFRSKQTLRYLGILYKSIVNNCILWFSENDYIVYIDYNSYF